MVSVLAWVSVCAVGVAVSAESAPSESTSLKQDIRAAMRATLPSQGAIDDAEARALLGLYQRLDTDETIADPERGRLRDSLKRRLVTAAEQAHRRAERAERQSKTVALPGDGSHVLAQQQPVAPPAPGAAPPGTAPPNVAQDSGDELARLIVATIAPESWEQNGGNGSIYYYQQWQCLVVRQTDDIHRRLGRLAVNLRQP